MVKKLFKYEIQSYFNSLLPVFAVVLGIGLLNRGIQLFENETAAYDIVFWSSFAALIISIIVCLVMTTIVSVRRFYKNLFTREGYLSFTLPVTSLQHLWVKLATALLFLLIACIACLLAGCAAAAGEPLVEFLKAVGYGMKEYFRYMKEAGHGTLAVLYLIEAVLALFLAAASWYAKVYACISIGQMAKKKRVLAAFGAYFGLYLLAQILGTVLVVRMSALWETDLFMNLGKMFEKNAFMSVEWAIVASLFVTAARTALFGFIAERIMTKKLNLE